MRTVVQARPRGDAPRAPGRLLHRRAEPRRGWLACKVRPPCGSRRGSACERAPRVSESVPAAQHTGRRFQDTFGARAREAVATLSKSAPCGSRRGVQKGWRRHVLTAEERSRRAVKATPRVWRGDRVPALPGDRRGPRARGPDRAPGRARLSARAGGPGSLGEPAAHRRRSVLFVLPLGGFPCHGPASEGMALRRVG